MYLRNYIEYDKTLLGRTHADILINEQTAKQSLPWSLLFLCYFNNYIFCLFFSFLFYFLFVLSRCNSDCNYSSLMVCYIIVNKTNPCFAFFFFACFPQLLSLFAIRYYVAIFLRFFFTSNLIKNYSVPRILRRFFKHVLIDFVLRICKWVGGLWGGNKHFRSWNRWNKLAVELVGLIAVWDEFFPD